MSKKKFSDRKKEIEAVVEKPVTVNEEKTADKIADKDSDGVVVIDMGPRKRRDRYASLRPADSVVETPKEEESKPEETTATTQEVDSTFIDSRVVNVTPITFDSESISSLHAKTENEISELTTKVGNLELSIKDLLDTYNISYISLSGLITGCNANTDKVKEELKEEMTKHINDICIYIAQSKQDVRNELKEEIRNRCQSEDLIRNSIESLSGKIVSTSEGFDDYKARHELVHSSIESFCDNIKDAINELDPKPVIEKVEHNQEVSSSIRTHTAVAIDFLIRITRMLGLSFIALVMGFILITAGLSVTGMAFKIVLDVLAGLCLAFVVYESTNINITIKAAKNALDDLIRDSYL